MDGDQLGVETIDADIRIGCCCYLRAVHFIMDAFVPPSHSGAIYR
jgi:hypothetical protein